MTPSDHTMALMYNLCERDDDCERGLDHKGPCGLAVRDQHEVVRYIDSEDER
jgi:hypothetical protein